MTKPKGWDHAFTAESHHGTVKGSPSYAGALSFLRRPYTKNLEGVDVAVTGIPLDLATTHRPGARFGPLSLVHFDAHSDTWNEDSKRLNHGTMFYHAVREGWVDDSRSVQIGLRTTNDEPMNFNILDARRVHAEGPGAVAEYIRGVTGDHPVYLTFDIDCLDPAFAPGTGTPVCGGLSTHQALEILRGIAGINLIGMDVVEVAPVYDSAEITSLAGATLAAEMLCLFAANPHRKGS